MTESKKPPAKPQTRPPNKPAVPGMRIGPAPKKIITGGMTVEITIGEVSIVISGPMPKVLAVLNWLFGTKEPEKLIASLQLVFGPEVSMTRR